MNVTVSILSHAIDAVEFDVVLELDDVVEFDVVLELDDAVESVPPQATSIPIKRMSMLKAVSRGA